MRIKMFPIDAKPQELELQPLLFIHNDMVESFPSDGSRHLGLVWWPTTRSDCGPVGSAGPQNRFVPRREAPPPRKEGGSVLILL